MKEKTCCFLGHRKITESEELKDKLYQSIENLILQKGVEIFIFGSKSEFDKLCLDIVTLLKEKYPYIKRIYVRAEYPYITDDYKEYLLKFYDDTYFPQNALNSGKAVYIKRNKAMIDRSEFCIIYYDENYSLPKSGTKYSYEYAVKNKKSILLFN